MPPILPPRAAPAALELERRVDLLLLAGVAVTSLVMVLGMIWVVPMLAVAAIAAIGEEA